MTRVEPGYVLGIGTSDARRAYRQGVDDFSAALLDHAFATWECECDEGFECAPCKIKSYRDNWRLKGVKDA